MLPVFSIRSPALEWVAALEGIGFLYRGFPPATGFDRPVGLCCGFRRGVGVWGDVQGPPMARFYERRLGCACSDGSQIWRTAVTEFLWSAFGARLSNAPAVRGFLELRCGRKASCRYDVARWRAFPSARVSCDPVPL